MSATEEMLKIIESVVNVKMGNQSKEKREIQIQETYNSIKHYNFDINEFRRNVEEYKVNPAKRWNSGFIVEIAKPKNIINQQTNDKYLELYSRVNFENLPDQKYEIYAFSRFLANSFLVSYTIGDIEKKRRLTESEYRKVSEMRVIRGNGELLPYHTVKNTDRNEYNIESIIQSVNIGAI